MTIKEIVDKVSRGDLTPVEVYEDIISDWSEEKWDSLQFSFLAICVQGHGDLANQEAENCGICYCYLERRWREEHNIPIDEEAESKIITNNTPALDFLFHSNEGLRNRFISFFKSGHGKLKITASDVVQILFFALNGRDRFDALEKNGFSPKYLWNDLRLVGVLGDIVKDVGDRTLNIAAQKALPPKPDVKTAWESF